MKGSNPVCPWWLAYSFDNPLRRLFHRPEKNFSGLVTEGQTAIDIGCGMGYFSLGLARLVGESGLVIAADLQEKMLRTVRRRAESAGLQSRIRIHQCKEDTIALSEPADFILNFWMLHEVPDQMAFLREVRKILKSSGHYLLVEPKLHVNGKKFEASLELARQAGFRTIGEPAVRLSRAALLETIALK